MTEGYFSDRTLGPKPRVREELPTSVWGALVSLVTAGLARHIFGEDFPEACPDVERSSVIGCDVDAFRQALRGDLPEIEWPLDAEDPPDLLAALDLVEFLHHHVSEPSQRGYHDFFGHAHLRFDRAAGRHRLRETVNRLFMRNGLAFELEADGRVQRLAAPVIGEQVRAALPPTTDPYLDELLERARRKHQDPDVTVRREGLEQLWDAFERVKTVLDPDKKAGATMIAESSAQGSAARADVLAAEMRTLSDIGNQFRIRHHETRTDDLDTALVDYLFARMYALMLRLLPALRPSAD